MGSISKCQKLNKQQNDKQCEDRISNLPSSLISHILSLLPTKSAVATCVLSTQWKQLWTLITSLDFDYELLLHPEKSTNSPLQTCFVNFVCRVFELRTESCLRMFRLKGSQNKDFPQINTWVAASLVGGVQELDLSFWNKQQTDIVLPQDLFACRTMVVLKLCTGFVMNVPTSVRMQSLKILHLHSVKLIDDDSIYRLICGCPVLDELSMGGCVGKDVHVIHIFAPVLTKLFIKELVYFDALDKVLEHEIVLDTPSLLHLEVENGPDSIEVYLVKNLSRLITANIDIRVSSSTENVSQCVTDLLVGISSLQCLHLHRGFIGVLYEYNYHVPVFRNLTTLKLDLANRLPWELMLRLLKKLPRLKTLVFSNDYEDDDPRDWNPPQNVPKCLGSHLKVVEIFDCIAYEEELKIVEYFLKNAKVLEKMIIHCQNFDHTEDKKEQVEALKKLLRLPRGSKFCQIEMC